MSDFLLFGLDFVRNAFVAGLLASIACGVIGSYVVVKRMVSVSGGISHASFGGIGLGYLAGFDPLLGALGFTLAAALVMGVLGQRVKQQMDTLVGVVWAVGMSLGILFVALAPGYTPDLFSFLFGNILLVPTGDLLLMGILAVAIVVIVILLYYPLLAVAFDQEYAAVMNLPVMALELLLLSMVALSVVMLIRVVGIILVIALLTLPAAISREFSRGLSGMMACAVAAGILFTFGGIWLSYILDAPSGATIILLAAAGYGLVLAWKYLRSRPMTEEIRNPG